MVTQTFAGFDRSQVVVSILSDATASGGSVAADRVLAGIFIAGFLTLAFFFSLLASRALHGQLARFLDAARRLAGGDFSSPVPTSGHDEFALLGEEFNTMSRQLERRLAELEQERARVRQAIRRIGEAFASGLDRDALLELALETAMDATDAERGRVSARQSADDVLTETVHVGRLAGLEGPIYDAERRALTSDGVGEASHGEVYLATVALGRDDARRSHPRPHHRLPRGAPLHRGRSGAAAVAGRAGHPGDGQRQPALRRPAPGDHRRPHRHWPRTATSRTCSAPRWRRSGATTTRSV